MKLNALKIHQENEYKKYEEKRIAEERAKLDAMSPEERLEYTRQKAARRKKLADLLGLATVLGAMPYNDFDGKGGQK